MSPTTITLRWVDGGDTARLMIGPHRVGGIENRLDRPGVWNCFVFLPTATGSAVGHLSALTPTSRAHAMREVEARVQSWFALTGAVVGFTIA
jgi:hypothetical protein